MMQRRTLLFGAAASVLLLGACSNGGGSPAGGDGEMDAKIAGDLTYAIWDVNQQPAMKELAAAFTAEHPDVKITVEVTPYSEYFKKLQTQGSSGTLPDVFWMNGPNFQLYASNDLLEPITGLIDEGQIDPANYPQALNDLYTYDGVPYGPPKDYDTVAIFYNKDLFDKAGVEYPSKDWTWEDFHTSAQTISTKLDGVYGSVAGLTGGQEMYYNTMLQGGGHVISEDGATSGYDDPGSIKGLQFVRDLIKDGSMPDPGQLSDTPPNQWFINERAGMFWSGTWSNAELVDSAIVDKIGVAPLPAGERSATVIHGLTNVVAAGSDNLATAQAFQAFLGSKEAALIQAESGAANPAFTGSQEAWLASAPYDLQIFLDEAEKFSYPYPISLNTAAWNQVENDLLPKAFSGERPVDEVAAEIAEKMNALLAKESS